MSDALNELAGHLGVVDRWWSLDGSEQRPGAATKRALIAAQGIDPATSETKAPPLPADVIVLANQTVSVPLQRSSGQLTWELRGEDDSAIASGKASDAAMLPALAPGLYELILDDASYGEPVLIIAAPEGPPTVFDVSGKGRIWGWLGSLYGLRSERNLGGGDYGDLADAVASLASLGGDFFGINPVHALGDGLDAPISPYSPSDRAAYNTAAIAIDRLPEFAASALARRWFAENQATIAASRSGAFVDYAAAARLRHEALPLLYATFESIPQRVDAFERWRANPGGSSTSFALFEALAEHHGPSWTSWPTALRDTHSTATRAAASDLADRVRFHAWLQWLADQQLKEAQKQARNAGMRMGLYLDLAVGARPDGAETWLQPEAYAQGVTLGAPPDAFSPTGQDWALAPFSPLGLRRSRYRPFLRMLRATMRHAGMIRIDHAFGLNRAFWRPTNGVPGGYVRYPMASLMALIRIEAQRAGCVVIGEDLGVMPEGFRDQLADAGLYGCNLMQFERQRDGVFHRPSSYRRAGIASFGSHDTPTIHGWLEGRDIDWRSMLGQLPNEVEARADRARSREGLEWMLRQEGALAEDETRVPAVTDAVHRSLASGASVIAAVQLEDAVSETEQANIPGTVDSHPNWRRRLPVAVPEIASSEPLRHTAALMRQGRDEA